MKCVKFDENRVVRISDEAAKALLHIPGATMVKKTIWKSIGRPTGIHSVTNDEYAILAKAINEQEFKALQEEQRKTHSDQRPLIAAVAIIKKEREEEVARLVTKAALAANNLLEQAVPVDKGV